MLTRKEKGIIIKNLTEQIKTAKALVITDYKGINVNDLRKLRCNLREKEIFYGIFKKSLIQLAFKEAGLEFGLKDYKGPLALAVAKKEEVEGAKIADNFSKEHKELKIVGGVLEGKFLTSEEVLVLAKLPGKEELIAKVVGSIRSPLSKLVCVLNGSARDLLVVLKAITQAKEA